MYNTSIYSLGDLPCFSTVFRATKRNVVLEGKKDDLGNSPNSYLTL